MIFLLQGAPLGLAGRDELICIQLWACELAQLTD